MRHEVDAAGAFVLFKNDLHCSAGDSSASVGRIDRDIADIYASIGSQPIANHADDDAAYPNKAERIAGNFLNRFFQPTYRTIGLGIGCFALQCDKRLDVISCCLLKTQVRRYGRTGAVWACHHSVFLALLVTERTGVSGMTPPLRLPKVSRPVSSHLPSTARFAQLSQDSVQSPSE